MLQFLYYASTLLACPRFGINILVTATVRQILDRVVALNQVPILTGAGIKDIHLV
jgi:hypothetical protein